MNSNAIVSELSSIIGTEYNPLFHDFYIEQTAFNLKVSEQSVIDALHIWYKFEQAQNCLSRISNSMNPNPVPASTKRRSDFVYLAKYTPDSDLYKIGISTNPVSRIKSMNRVCPSVSIELIHSFESDNALKTEKNLHNKYGSKRVSTTEWFRLDESDVDYLTGIKCDFEGELQYEW